MSKVIIMQGIQGSGKSTWAKNWVAEDPTQRVRWNNDSIREMFGVYWVPERESLNALDPMKVAFLEKFMSSNYDIVIDDMNLNPKTFRGIEALVKVLNNKLGVEYEVEYHLMTTPLNVCIERDSKRPNPIGEKVIKDTFKRYQSYLVSEANKAELAKRVPLEAELPSTVIVDIDGVVAFNITGRPFFGPECNNNLHKDYRDSRMAELLYILRKHMHIVFLTGRNEDARVETTAWLNNNLFYNPCDNSGHHDYSLIMRPEGDRSPGPECKKRLYEEKVKGKYNVLAVFEDQDKNVKMWRDLGLLCLQTNNGGL